MTPKKGISKCPPVTFFVFLDHLGIKNMYLVFSFGMRIAELSLHNVSYVFFFLIREKSDDLKIPLFDDFLAFALVVVVVVGGVILTTLRSFLRI